MASIATFKWPFAGWEGRVAAKTTHPSNMTSRRARADRCVLCWAFHLFIQFFDSSKRDLKSNAYVMKLKYYSKLNSLVKLVRLNNID
ncbi:hypothetical protein RJT34_09312 [Clitoria ternatea]|uniref:Uncharacterized protein n=1 Tax=Clitoria ternatea TaxID=43366 RepID=A0AAN9K772_CLITE